MTGQLTLSKQSPRTMLELCPSTQLRPAKAHLQRPSSSQLVTAPPEMDYSDSYCPGVTEMLKGRVCNQLRLPGREKQHVAIGSVARFLKDFF